MFKLLINILILLLILLLFKVFFIIFIKKRALCYIILFLIKVILRNHFNNYSKIIIVLDLNILIYLIY